MGTHFGHGHSHGSSADHSDCMTKVGAIGGFPVSFLGNTYWIATCIDLAWQNEPWEVGVSWEALTIAAVFAIFAAVGAAYTHAVLNTTHQKKKSDGDAHHPHEHKPLLDNKTKPHTAIDVATNDDENPLSAESANKTTASTSTSHKSHLNALHYLALLGDWIDHTGGNASILTLLILHAFPNIARWKDGAAIGGATLYSIIVAFPDVRSCFFSLEDTLEQSAHHKTLNNDENARRPHQGHGHD